MIRRRAGAKLLVDRSGLASWRSLNPTERSSTLPATWLIHADSTVRGDGRFASMTIPERLTVFFSACPTGGMGRFGVSPEKEALRHSGRFVNVRAPSVARVHRPAPQAPCGLEEA